MKIYEVKDGTNLISKHEISGKLYDYIIPIGLYVLIHCAP